MSLDLGCALMAILAVTGFGFLCTCRMLARVEDAIIDVFYCMMDGDDREFRLDDGESWKGDSETEG